MALSNWGLGGSGHRFEQSSLTCGYGWRGAGEPCEGCFWIHQLVEDNCRERGQTLQPPLDAGMWASTGGGMFWRTSPHHQSPLSWACLAFSSQDFSVALCNSVDQAGLQLKNPSASLVLALKAHTTKLSVDSQPSRVPFPGEPLGMQAGTCSSCLGGGVLGTIPGPPAGICSSLLSPLGLLSPAPPTAPGYAGCTHLFPWRAAPPNCRHPCPSWLRSWQRQPPSS